MGSSTISGTVTQTVVLGETGNYRNHLTITDTGVIAPTAYGDGGIYVPAGDPNAHIINNGSVSAAYGGHGSLAVAGGIGIDFVDAGKLVNTGTVTGGLGGYYTSQDSWTGRNGGNGVNLTGGCLIDNSGRIAGGHGGVAKAFPGSGGTGVNAPAGTIMNAASGIITGGYGGGAGVDLGASASLVNNGFVAGGTGVTELFDYGGGVGGSGVAVNGGTLSNTGLIDGGQAASNLGYADGGAGVQILAGILTNAGTITGGSAAYAKDGGSKYWGGGEGITSYATVLNTGVVIGGTGSARYVSSDNGGRGGYGVALGAGVFTNKGEVIGGAGGSASKGYGGAGGAGVLVGGGTFLNNGTITGGLNSDTGAGTNLSGATGAVVNSGELTNTGTIIGATSFDEQSGGVGVYLGVEYGSSNGTLSNSGLIIGGAGSAESPGHNGGSGGTAVVVTNNDIVTNAGTILGGTGGTYYGFGGTGATIQSGGTLITSGTIAGGLGGKEPGGGTEPSGNAVVIGGGTLVIDPGAVFSGGVDANDTDNSVVVLGAGSATGSISGFGKEFSGLLNLQVQAGATWQMAGTNSFAADSLLTDAGRLTITGILTDTGPATVSGTLGVSGTAIINGITLDGGTLTAASSGKTIIGTAKGGKAGAITVESGAAVTGFGAIMLAPVTDDGTIAAQGGLLSVATAVTGTGTLAIAASSTLLVGAAVSGVTLDFTGAGTLSLAAPTDVTSTIAGFQSGDVVDLQNLIATTLSYHGGTLTLGNGQSVVDKLTFTGTYKLADFALKPDGAGGTEVIYAGAQAAEFGSAALQDLAAGTALREGGDGSPGFWHLGDGAVPGWLSAGFFMHDGR
jgi:hypothetical protein